jgi:hypothetical protein
LASSLDGISPIHFVAVGFQDKLAYLTSFYLICSCSFYDLSGLQSDCSLRRKVIISYSFSLFISLFICVHHLPSLQISHSNIHTAGPASPMQWNQQRGLGVAISRARCGVGVDRRFGVHAAHIIRAMNTPRTTGRHEMLKY